MAKDKQAPTASEPTKPFSRCAASADSGCTSGP